MQKSETTTTTTTTKTTQEKGRNGWSCCFSRTDEKKLEDLPLERILQNRWWIMCCGTRWFIPKMILFIENSKQLARQYFPENKTPILFRSETTQTQTQTKTDDNPFATELSFPIAAARPQVISNIDEIKSQLNTHIDISPAKPMVLEEITGLDFEADKGANVEFSNVNGEESALKMDGDEDVKNAIVSNVVEKRGLEAPPLMWDIKMRPFITPTHSVRRLQRTMSKELIRAPSFPPVHPNSKPKSVWFSPVPEVKSITKLSQPTKSIAQFRRSQVVPLGDGTMTTPPSKHNHSTPTASPISTQSPTITPIIITPPSSPWRLSTLKRKLMSPMNSSDGSTPPAKNSFRIKFRKEKHIPKNIEKYDGLPPPACCIYMYDSDLFLNSPIKTEMVRRSAYWCVCDKFGLLSIPSIMIWFILIGIAIGFGVYGIKQFVEINHWIQTTQRITGSINLIEWNQQLTNSTFVEGIIHLSENRTFVPKNNQCLTTDEQCMQKFEQIWEIGSNIDIFVNTETLEYTSVSNPRLNIYNTPIEENNVFIFLFSALLMGGLIGFQILVKQIQKEVCGCIILHHRPCICVSNGTMHHPPIWV